MSTKITFVLAALSALLNHVNCMSTVGPDLDWMAQMETRLSDLEQLNSMQVEIISDLEETIDVLEERVSDLEGGSDGSADDSSDLVGFTAYLTSSRTYEINEIMIFDEVLTDLGDHFNTTSGTFKCPYKGVYVFSANVLAFPNERAYGQIYLDEEFLVGTSAEPVETDPEHNSQASTFVVTECGEGQVVSVRSWEKSRPYGYGYRMTSFSGYMLRRLD